jgi:hypothetical protein
MDDLWVVVGESGNYSDYEMWVVGYCATEEEATTIALQYTQAIETLRAWMRAIDFDVWSCWGEGSKNWPGWERACAEAGLTDPMATPRAVESTYDDLRYTAVRAKALGKG